MRKVLKKIILLILVIICICKSFNYLKNKSNNNAFTKEKIEEKTKERVVINEAYISQILNVSKLYTYNCTYNGICTIQLDNDKKSTYHCSYNSIVNMGIDCSNISLSIEDKNIFVTIPEIQVLGVSVDSKSLDYMNLDNKIDASSIFQISYNAAAQNACNKCMNDEKLKQLAMDNAKNSIRAMILPIIENTEYELLFYDKKEG